MRRGLSLAELVIVIVILAIIAALAMPRMSRAAGANPEATLREELRVLRVAIERYQQDHGGLLPGDSDCDPDLIVRQLCGFTDASGNAGYDRDEEHVFGPYLRALPRNPLSAAGTRPTLSVSAGQPGDWHYDCGTGYIRVQLPGSDSRGMPFGDY